jgi:hypothetical protein
VGCASTSVAGAAAASVASVAVMPTQICRTACSKLY